MAETIAARMNVLVTGLEPLLCCDEGGADGCWIYCEEMEVPLIAEAEDATFRAAVQLGIKQADRGEFIEEGEMDARVERMLRS